jgi:hypothetical protein
MNKALPAVAPRVGGTKEQVAREIKYRVTKVTKVAQRSQREIRRGLRGCSWPL